MGYRTGQRAINLRIGLDRRAQTGRTATVAVDVHCLTKSNRELHGI